jgi:alpha-L-rhamnosidase
MHVLSDYGHTDIAYSLLLREEYPSWLYQVRKGATTTWEHWDGIKEDGSFWDTNMNSFNHYAYGAVIDWVYGVACGIKAVDPGYSKIRIAPHPDHRLDWMKATLNTRNGIVHSEWKKQDGGWRYEITTPVETQIVIGGKQYDVNKGTYYFFEKIT